MASVMDAEQMDITEQISSNGSLLGEPVNSLQRASPPPRPVAVEQKCRVYPGRFYVLIVLALFAMHQNIAWMTFSTIPNESFQHFGLTNNNVTLIAACGPVAFILLAFPFMWFLDRFGLQVSMLCGAWIQAIGIGIRCFVPDGTKWNFVFYIGHFMIGVAGLPAMMMPPRLSSVWFPPGERTFATALTTMAKSVGVAVAFVTVPYLTRHYDIHTMLYIHAELGLFIALLATIYFPPHPRTPPSLSANTRRTKFISSMKALSCNRAFLVLCLSGGLVTGGTIGFSSVLSIVLNPTTAGFSNKVNVHSLDEFFHSNAWLGACTAIFGAIGGQVIGPIADRFQKKFKLLLLILLTFATLLAFWFAVSVYGYTSNNAINLFISLCIQYSFAFAATPLYFEAAVEVTYPVPEGSSAGVLSVIMSIAAFIFQMIGLCHIFSNDHPEKARVMVWVLGGLTGLAGMSMLLYEEKYRRFDVDTHKSNKIDPEEESCV